MRKVYCLFTITLVLSIYSSAVSQVVPAGYTNTVVNYVRSWDAKAPEANPNNLMTRPVQDVIQSTQYLDGLGRPIQTVIKSGAAPTGGSATDIVKAMYYDVFGRESLKFLPYATTSVQGTFRSSPFQSQTTFYTTQLSGQQETYYYGESRFEASPLNRVDKELAPGNNWIGQNRGTEFKYWINTSADSVKIWNVSNVAGGWGNYSISGSYQPGQLYKTTNIDEHGKQVIQFTDKSGKTILKKVALTSEDIGGAGSGYSGWLCTYYIYDDFENLRCVVQPKGVELLILGSWVMTSDILNEQTFRYEYDHRNRMVMKKVPGAGEVWMVYDRWDRLVLTQDANLRGPHNWIYTKYDELNRPIITGIHHDPGNITLATMNSHVVEGEGWQIRYESRNATNGYTLTQSFPYEISNGVYTTTYYDDYAWVPNNGYLISSAYNTTYNSHLSTNSTSYPYPQPVTQSFNTKGMVTGTFTRIIGSPYSINTVMIYDKDGRLIQTQNNTVTGELEVFTTQYNFTGQPLTTVQKTGGSVIVTKMTYDPLARLEKIEKKLSNTLINSGAMSSYRTIVQNEYDKLGQLKKKTLGTTLGEQLDYEYNIRGWLLGLNRGYLAAQDTRSFGFELAYDKINNSRAVNGIYATAQFNGNINGSIWKSKGDQILRKFDYSYDAANRLLGADFTQANGSGYDNNKMNFTVDSIMYDLNGNLKKINTLGFKGLISTSIDKLTYGYQTNSNKLSGVSDLVSDPDTKLGDFKDGTNGSSDDYAYDLNGNLTVDQNKSISGITYNYLNLPSVISVAGKGTITYTYDASGNKLLKVVSETGQADKTTIYMGGLVYQDNVLQFIPHEEGRIRFTPAVGSTPARFDYDYFIKDHLGNVRMVLTEEQQQTVYPAATLEGELATSTDAVFIEKDYYSIQSAKIVLNSEVTGITPYQNNNSPGYPYNNNPNSITSANSTKLYKLTGTDTGGVTGLGITLKVMAGDKISVFGKSYYFQNSPGTNYDVPVLSLLEGFIGSAAGLAVGKGATAIGLNGIPSIANAINGFLDSSGRGSGTVPKAYINWVFFNEQFEYAGGGFERVGDENATVKSHSSGLVTVPKNGYVYVYVSNESLVDVFFDNLQVVHDKGPLLEETHYYPFGLTMAGISSQAAGRLSNKYQFGGKEKQQKEFGDGSGLDYLDFGWRMYDAQIGRFFTQDAYAEKYDYLTPYHYGGNNPANYIEAGGDSIYIHWDSKNVLQIWEAIGNLLKTEDGKKLWNEYAGSTENDIYIGMNTFKSKDDEGNSSNTVAATIKNVNVKDGKIDFSRSSQEIKDDASSFNGHDVSKSNGRTVSIISLNDKYWTGTSKKSTNELSEALYHEMAAHIKSTKTSAYEQHKEYGNMYSGLKLYYKKVTKMDTSGNWPVHITVNEEWKVPKGSPYYRIREQLLQIKDVKKGKP